ncbi:MAG: hypothetical protein Barrevirus37_5 [Barrevirus sp.]|uniref:Uncharacterized protein n=1 Tax=Barrevirus sp. TaxID=2487763 RepID=A0A3G4ZR04_9VIRU|nr:MAG: hypothetical protein Barrevirus37_5 [Barrevirus sp.]
MWTLVLFLSCLILNVDMYCTRKYVIHYMNCGFK